MYLDSTHVYNIFIGYMLQSHICLDLWQELWIQLLEASSNLIFCRWIRGIWPFNVSMKDSRCCFIFCSYLLYGQSRSISKDCSAVFESLYKYFVIENVYTIQFLMDYFIQTLYFSIWATRIKCRDDWHRTYYISVEETAEQIFFS